MKFKPNMPILVLTLLLLSICGCLGLGVFTHYFNRDLYRATKEVSANWIPSINILSDMRADIHRIRRTEANSIFSIDFCPAPSCAAAIAKQRQKLSEDEKKYLPLVGPPEERLLYDSYLLQKAIYYNQLDDMFQRGGGDPQAIQKFLGESAQQFEATAELLDRLIAFNSQQGEASQAAVQKYYQDSQNYLFISNVILGITAGLLVLRLLILFVS